MTAPASQDVSRPPAKGAALKQEETPLEVIASTAATLVIVMFIFAFNLQAFAIPTGSMEKTLLIGDHVFVDRISFAPPGSGPHLLPYRSIRRGDIVVFYKPGEPDLHLVKRVVGIPGDHIRLAAGVLYVNGVAQPEPYVEHSIGDYNPFRDDFPSAAAGYADPLTPQWRSEIGRHIEHGELVVPPDCYFGMGDNRDNSLDSRYWGFIPRQNVIGTPWFIYWSFATPPDDYLKTSLRDRAASTVNVVLHFFDETRWQRMFHTVR